MITDNAKTEIYFMYELSTVLKVYFLFSLYPFNEYTKNDIILNIVNIGPLYIFVMYIRKFTTHKSIIRFKKPTKL